MTDTERRLLALGYFLVRAYVPETGWAAIPFAVRRARGGQVEETFGTYWKLLAWIAEKEAK